ncbi:MAG TPA: helix-turn-helix domain-containing protein [Thermoleophilaceae bacterium]
MDVPAVLRDARRAAGLSQAALAARSGTSQATVSAYESGRKQPSVDTLGRLLAATGARLAVETGLPREPSPAEHERVARTLVDVLALAEALPARHDRVLRAARGVNLPERLVALHRALAGRRLPHAFGGAIALAYWTLDPRGTSDIDVNVFVPASDAARVLRALPAGIAQPDGVERTIARDGQVRLWWDETPVDLFLDYAPVHADAARNRRTVRFAGTRIPVLGPIELAAFKVMFDRTRDWADVEAMLAAGSLDVDALRASLRTLVDPGDERFARLDEAVRRAEPSVAPG